VMQDEAGSKDEVKHVGRAMSDFQFHLWFSESDKQRVTTRSG